MSLDLLFWKLLIILDISFELHSSRNIEFIFEGITHSSKEQKPISEIVCSFMLSFRFDAIELKYWQFGKRATDSYRSVTGRLPVT